jgi:ABC-type nickel/cobalt efflux system permease component RcnA
MNYAPELLLVAAVAAVGVLHTIVPDHWVPITLLARQRGWSKSETARASLQAGTGHVLSTLLIALVVWFAGVAFAERFGHVVDVVSSLALIAFGGWIAISAWRDLRTHGGHGHSHGLAHETQFTEHDHAHHGHGHDHGHDHDHNHKTTARMALLLILGSSPMVEGIPVFFAAGKYGVGLIAVMAVVFGISTIATYVLLCVYSTAGLQRVRLGAFERYGEVLSGAFIALVGLVFWIWPVL